MRIDLDTIQSYISTDSYVLDLACGDGNLLLALQKNKNITGVGLENDPDYISACIKSGVSVIEHDLNKGLHHINDKTYDTVVMTLALQAMQKPDVVLEEMLRIGKECIITFPNFAHWKARWHLLAHGRMPMSDLLPYEWYNTPNVRVLTIRDFEALAPKVGLVILDRVVLHEGNVVRWGANWRGSVAVYRVRAG